MESGEIIEQYPDDFPYPSCLILGQDIGNGYIHTVVGSEGTTLWIITAYHPSPDKWESDFKTIMLTKIKCSSIPRRKT